MTTTSIALRCAETVSVILDSIEVADLIEQLEFLRWTGRPGYSTRTLMGVVLTKSLYAIPTWTRTLELVRDHAGLRAAIGCVDDTDVPSKDAMYRFNKKLRRCEGQRQECIDSVLASLRSKTPGMGEDVAIDGSSIPAYANGQRYKSKGGKERKPEEYSDPDASWGHRSAVSTRAAGSYYGYKLHMAVDAATDLPLAWTVETAKDAEARFALPLLDEVIERGFSVRTAAMDKGYDIGPIYDGCEERGVRPIIPLKETGAVKKGDHKPPVCKHGVWQFAGADYKEVVPCGVEIEVAVLPPRPLLLGAFRAIKSVQDRRNRRWEKYRSRRSLRRRSVPGCLRVCRRRSVSSPGLRRRACSR